MSCSFNGSHKQRFFLISEGYLLALASICLLQYVMLVRQLAQFREQTAEQSKTADALKEELKSLDKDLRTNTQENRLLREFVGEADFEKAVGLFLNRLTSQSPNDFAIILDLTHPNGPVTVHHRGMSQLQAENVRLDETLQSVFATKSDQRVFEISKDDLSKTQLWSTLPYAAVEGTSALWFGTIGQASHRPIGVLVTNSLYPNSATRETQKELLDRLLTGIAKQWKQHQIAEDHEAKLRSTHEILELRAITDREYQSPGDLMDQFLRSLLPRVKADRGVVAIVQDGQGGELQVRPLVVAGRSVQEHLQRHWDQHEQCLFEDTLHQKELTHYSVEDLNVLGVDTLIHTAMTIPLMQDQRVIGVICLTKQTAQPFDLNEQQLVRWAGNHLTEMLLRSLNNAAIHRQAKFDSLTGLANRRTFDDSIKRAIQLSELNQQECSLLLLDLDHFKSVNDTYGHLAGDAVLKYFGTMLREELLQVRSSDGAMAARYGGEEIAILLPGVGLGGANRIAEMIRKRLDNTPIDIGGQILDVTVSIGTATFPDHAADAAELIGATDAALYHAKNSGRNRVSSIGDAVANPSQG